MIMVKLQSCGRRKVFVPFGTRSLADALAAHGLPMKTRCGKRGLCRGCEVELRAGRLTVEDAGITAPTTVQAHGVRGGRGHDDGGAANGFGQRRSAFARRSVAEYFKGN